MGYEDLKGYVPQWVEDSDNEVVALKGKYEAVVKDFNYNSEYKFVSVKFQVSKTVSGIAGERRYLDKTFNLEDGQYSTGVDNIKKLLTLVYNISKKEVAYQYEDGDTTEMTSGKLLLAMEPIKDATAKLSVWPNTKDGIVKLDKNGWPKHIFKVVSEFKVGKEKAGAKPTKQVIADF